MARRYGPELEEDSEAMLVKAVRLAGGLCFKLKFLGIGGAPDRLVLLPFGRLFFVEMKKTKGKLEDSQEILFPLLARLGFTVHILKGPVETQQFITRHVENAL